MQHRFEYALVGGGLQNALIALAVHARRPGARIAMIERGHAIGGNHTWCFHAGDLGAERAAWIDPLVTTRWAGYDVAFPDHARRLDSPYACVTSERLAEVVTGSLGREGSSLRLRTDAIEVHPDRVVVRTAAGVVEEIHAAIVIDARGPDRASAEQCGWQKFVGQEVELEAPHGLDRPMLMDATVPQVDGFRFIYLLPFSPTRVLVEDTYFSDRAYLDVGNLRERIAEAIAARGWRVARIVREEVGVLPLPLRAAAPSTEAPLAAGYGGGWFHPVTGYSFPIASRLAELVAARPELYGAELDAEARRHASQQRFALQLNRMLFRWFAPAQRYRVLERFYRLPEAVIRRFYALELTRMDRARILVGRPPRGLSIRAMFGGEAA